MSKTWYPVINYELCKQCGACVNKCTHGVYNKDKAPRPVVVHPEGCIQNCTGCANLCPAGAIAYFGDSKSAKDADCCCSDGCGCGDGCCGSENP